jgi:hypothetical protein
VRQGNPGDDAVNDWIADMMSIYRMITGKEPATSVMRATRPQNRLTPAEFEQLALSAMTNVCGARLAPGRVSGVPKLFDCVSEDRDIVGDAKFYTLVEGVRLPPAKFSIIAEHVWLLEKTAARRKFLAFGNDRRVPEEWLRRYGHLAEGVEFFFIDDAGPATRINGPTCEQDRASPLAAL